MKKKKNLLNFHVLRKKIKRILRITFHKKSFTSEHEKILRFCEDHFRKKDF